MTPEDQMLGAPMPAQKLSPDEAAYGPSDDPIARCSNCVHFQGDSCEVVDGPISPDGVSDLFEIAPSPSTGGTPVQMGFEA